MQADGQKQRLLLEARVRLSRFAIHCTLGELLQETLDAAEQLSGSQIGFFHFVEPDQQNLTLQAWSTNTLLHMCTAEGKHQHYAISRAGVWCDAFHSRAPVLHNDYAALTHRKGTPDGHALIQRELVVPMLRGDLVTALIGVGNKPTDYDADDVETLEVLLALTMDMVERKRAEEALRHGQAMLARTESIADVGSWEWDVATDITTWSAGLFRLFRRDVADGAPSFAEHPRFYEPASMAQLERVVEAAVRAGTPFELELRALRADGETRVCLVRGHAELGAGGTATRLYGSLQDITERKRAEEALAELNEQLTERVAKAVAELRAKDQLLIAQGRQAAMGEMIGNIAHQWRQPLNALGLVVANLKDSSRFGELDAGTLDRAVADSNRLIAKMSSTISVFANFFAPEKDKQVFSALGQLRETLALLEATFKNAGIGVEVEAQADVFLFGYSNEYAQVLLNLLSNARQAIEGSRVTPGRVTLRIEERDGLGCLTVRDNGGGIPAELLDRVFDPYFSTKPGGTGIGLYLSRQLAEKSLGGRLEVRNVEGGAEFALLTPLYKG